MSTATLYPRKTRYITRYTSHARALRLQPIARVNRRARALLPCATAYQPPQTTSDQSACSYRAQSFHPGLAATPLLHVPTLAHLPDPRFLIVARAP